MSNLNPNPKLVPIAHDQVSFLKSENNYYLVVFGKDGSIWKYKILPENKIFVDHILKLRKDDSLRFEREQVEIATKKLAKTFGIPYFNLSEKFKPNLMALEVIPYDICNDLKIVCYTFIGQIIKIAVTTNNEKIQDYLKSLLEDYPDKEIVIVFVSQRKFDLLMDHYKEELNVINDDDPQKNMLEIEREAHIRSKILSIKSFIQLLKFGQTKVAHARIDYVGEGRLYGVLKVIVQRIIKSKSDADDSTFKVTIKTFIKSIEKDPFELILLSFCHNIPLYVEPRLLEQVLTHQTTQLAVAGQFPANDILWKKLLS